MTEKDENAAARSESEAGQDPQVYGVEKNLDGWKFSRRDFVAAAATAAAAAAAVGAVASGQRSETPSLEKEGAEGAIALAIAMPAIMAIQPGELLTQIWQVTNHGAALCRGVQLYLHSRDGLQVPARVDIPDIAAGETVDIDVEMVAPAEVGTFTGNWHLNVADGLAPVAHSAFVLQTGCLFESTHPYNNSTMISWSRTNPDPDASSTRIHFSRVELASSDYIYVKDGTGQVIQSIAGYYSSGLWSEMVPGREIEVELATDASGTAWGFCVDQIQTVHIIYLPIVSRYPTPTPTYTPCPCDIHYCSCDTVCTCDSVCSCVGNHHYWYPN